MVHAGETVANELLRDVGEAIAVALLPLVGRNGLPLTNPTERAARPIGDAAVEVAVLVPVERPAWWIRGVLVDARHFQRLGVVERGMATAMLHGDRMILRHFIEIVHVQLALVFHLRIVEEVALHPCSGRRLLGLRPQFVDDAADRDEFNLERVADDHLVEQRVAAAHDCGSR